MSNNADDAGKRIELQLGLFQLTDTESNELVSNEHYTNALESIELMPRFYRGKGACKPIGSKTEKLQNQDALWKKQYTENGQIQTCEVTPAIITRKEKKEEVNYLAFPSDAEEVIEKICFYLATRMGLTKTSIGGMMRSGIFVSLYQIRVELIKVKKTKSYAQVRESLNVIDRSNTIAHIPKRDGNGTIQGHRNVIDKVFMEHTDSSIGSDKVWISFSDYVVGEIEKLRYRQVPHKKILTGRLSLTRFLYTYLSVHWRTAQEQRKEAVSLNDVMERFGRKDKSFESERRDMRRALQELVDKKVILAVPPAERVTENNKEDYSYYVTPTYEFVKEMIKSNSKHKGLRKLAEEIRLGERTALPSSIGRARSTRSWEKTE
jgi:hypothetical protein